MTPTHYSRGQALVELAVFGSLILMMLGLLLNYGLNADYEQQARMTAFRQGLKTAAESSNDNAPVSTSHQVIQDRHIPSPTDPFGVGSVVPASASASVTRNYQLQLVPENPLELPRLTVQIDGATVPDCCTTAGFRTEFGVSQSSLERYRFIYGGGNVCDEPECGGGESCVPGSEVTEINPISGLPETRCTEFLKTLLIVDPCEGQIVSYDDCLSQAAQIVDPGACDAACQKAAALGREGLDCARLCSQPMDGTPQPWYIAGAGCGGGTCTAPALDNVFDGSPALGVQSESTRVARRALRLRKSETAGGISTTSSGIWGEEITRTVVTQQGGGRVEQSLKATRGEIIDESQSTSW